MKNILKTLIILAFLNPIDLNAQKRFTVETQITEKGKSKGSYYLGTDRNGYLYYETYKSIFIGIGTIPVLYLKIVNPHNNQLLYDGKLQSSTLKKNGYKYISFEFFNNTPFIICRKKEDLSGSDYYAQEISHLGELIGRPFKIGSKGVCKGFKSGGSKNISKGLFYYFDKTSKEKYFITDLGCSGNSEETEFKLMHLNNTNNELFEENYNVPINSSYNNLEFVVKNGKAYLSFAVITREKVEGKLFKEDVLRNYLYALNFDGSVESIDLDLGSELAPSSISVTENNGKIIVTGKAVMNETNKIVGIYTGNIDTETNEIKDLKINNFNEELISHFFNKRQKEIANKKEQDLELVDDFKIMDNIKTADGGSIQFLQKYKVYTQTTSTMNSNGMSTFDTQTIYQYGDIIFYKTDHLGEVSWVNVMRFNQKYTNYDPEISYKLMENNGKIMMIHQNFTKFDSDNTDFSNTDALNIAPNGNIKNRSVVFVTSFNQKGEFTHYPVINLMKEKMVFSPLRVAADVKEGKFIIASTPTKLFKSKKRLQLKTIKLIY